MAYEYICGNVGRKFDIEGEEISLLNPEAYEELVKRNFRKSPLKLKKLMMEDIPDKFIERQLNDTRYISKIVRNLLSNIVRQEHELEAVSSNVLTVNGTITDKLKKDWGLNDVWNNILKDRFIRLNQLTKSSDFGAYVDNRFVPTVPEEYSRGFSKKRLDHRHHAMDAIVIACATRLHINYLNNLSAYGANATKEEKEKLRNDLRTILCGTKRNNKWIIQKPFPTFTTDIERILKNIVVSFKNNTRVITKSTNYYTRFLDGEKKLVKQEGENKAIRKPLHKDTVYGLVNLQRKRVVSLSNAIDVWQSIANRQLRAKIEELVNQGLVKKKIQEYFKELNYTYEGIDVQKVEVYYFTNDKDADRVVAVRKPLDETFDRKKIGSITDTGIQKILLRHLENYGGDNKLAFSADGLDVLNDLKNLCSLNDGKEHKPIKNVRITDTLGLKLKVGERGNKKDKYVKTAEGTNLFFAIYESAEGKRNFETIPLNVAIENLKAGLSVATEKNEAGDLLVFVLSPNNLVYLPTTEQIERGVIDVEDIQANRDRIYKFMSSTGKQAFFIPAFIASPVVQTKELGSNNKSERAWTGEMIKESCIKIYVDRLGHISL